MSFDEYAHSAPFHKLRKRKTQKKPLKIAFLDIDSTMTGSIESTNATRRKLEQLGYVIVYVTARTEEMLMSTSSYNASCMLGFSRPMPKLGRNADKYTYTPIEQIEPRGLLDPDIIAGSSGTQLYIKQLNGGYAPDKNFIDKLDIKVSWRGIVLDLLKDFNSPLVKAFLAPYEEIINYEKGISNVYPPQNRVTVIFQSAKIKNEFRSFIKNILKSEGSFSNIRLTDDSEPAKDLHQIHITPKNGSKTKAVDHIINQVCELLTLKRTKLHVLIAGDGHADFDMGMRAARGTCAIFLLPGGSRLMPALRCKNTHPELLDETLESLKSQIQALKIKGHYKSLIHENRELIICDEVCQGQIQAASLLLTLDGLQKI